jgi:hypothetical protein
MKRTSYRFNPDPVVEYKYPGADQHEKYYQAALGCLRELLGCLRGTFEYLTDGDVCRMLNDLKGEVTKSEILKSNSRSRDHA